MLGCFLLSFMILLGKFPMLSSYFLERIYTDQIWKINMENIVWNERLTEAGELSKKEIEKGYKVSRTK